MANALRLPNPTQQAAKKAERLLEDLQRRFQNRELLSQDDVRGAVYEALNRFFLTAAEPTFDGATLPARQPRKRSDYLDPVRRIADDLAVAYAEAGALADATSASFNFQNAFLESLQGRLKRAASTLIDLQIAQDRFNEAVIVAGDDFTDDSRVDPDATLSLPRADIQPLGGLLTLRRTGNESVIPASTVDIRVEPLQDYRERLYEGQFFGLIGQAVPEGGQFHFVERPAGQALREALPVDLARRFREFFSSGGGAAALSGDTQTGANPTPNLGQALSLARSGGQFGGFTENEWELLGGHIHNASELNTLLGGLPVEFLKALDPTTAILDQGASPAARLAGRRAMVDGNPDTFWQIEYVRSLSVVDPTSPPTRLPFGNLPQFLGIDRLFGAGQPGAEDQAAEQKRRDLDVLDLDVRITVDLGDIKVVNWVDLVPMLFDGIEHLEVLGIRSSIDGNSYDDLPRLREGETGTRISRSTNATLDAAAVHTVLATNASAFTGSGLWIFAPRSMRYLQIDLRQPVPVFVPYNVLQLTLSQVVRRRHSRNSFGRRRPSTQETVYRDVVLSYPETVQVTTGAADAANAAGSQAGRRVEGASGIDRLLAGDTSTGASSNLGQLLGLAIPGQGAVQNILQDGRGAAFQISGVAHLLGRGPIRGRTLYGNEEIVNQSLVTRWDRLRYAIGIRDLGVWQYQFTEASELVSVRYKSPAPIRDLSLEVDELIPKEFTAGREIASFIDYFVGLGEGQEWFPLAPVTSRVIRTIEGNAVPTVYHVNSGIPPAERNPAEGYLDFDQEVDQVRLRVVLRRPTDIEDDDNFTPALKSYRLTWTVRGGFR